MFHGLPFFNILLFLSCLTSLIQKVMASLIETLFITLVLCFRAGFTTAAGVAVQVNTVVKVNARFILETDDPSGGS